MSLFRQYAQPITGSWVNTQDENQGEGTPALFLESDVDTWYNANKSKVTKLSKNFYIIPGTVTASSFHSVLNGNNGNTQLQNSGGNIDPRKTLKDMGKEIVFGNSLVSRLLVLRKIQKFISEADGGSLSPTDTGYIVVENNSTELAPTNWGRFCVKVARA
jgi:hypothetical protein